jgi:hypothetical protein
MRFELHVFGLHVALQAGDDAKPDEDEDGDRYPLTSAVGFHVDHSYDPEEDE